MAKQKANDASSSVDKPRRKWPWILLIVVVLLVISGGYYHFTHDVADQVPGNVYSYNNPTTKRKLYMTFAKTGNEVVVTQNKTQATKAASSDSQFESVWQKQNKSNGGSWRYKADGSKLTLAQMKTNNKVSQWQYNNVFATSNKLTSRSFTYQIVNAGQGNVKQKVTFTKIN